MTTNRPLDKFLRFILRSSTLFKDLATKRNKYLVSSAEEFFHLHSKNMLHCDLAQHQKDRSH